MVRRDRRSAETVSRIDLLGLAAEWLEAPDNENLLLVHTLAILPTSHKVLQELLFLVAFIYFFQALDALTLLLLDQFALQALFSGCLGLRILIAVVESTERVVRSLSQPIMATRRFQPPGPGASPSRP